MQPLGGAALLVAGVARDDQLVLQAVLPAHQLGYGHAVALRLQVQAAQHVGQLAAQLARVQRVAPQLGQRRARQLQGLVLAQAGGQLGLAAGHQHHGLRLLGQTEGDGVVGGGVAGVQRSHHVDALGQGRIVRRIGRRDVQKMHARKTQPRRQRARALDQNGARLDAVDRATARVLEQQVVQDEAQVRLAGAVVGQRQLVAVRAQLAQHLLDELHQVLDLLELAPRVLVEPALAGEDVQRFQQLDRLAGAQLGLHRLMGRLGFVGRHASARRSGSLPRWGRVGVGARRVTIQACVCAQARPPSQPSPKGARSSRGLMNMTICASSARRQSASSSLF